MCIRVSTLLLLLFTAFTAFYGFLRCYRCFRPCFTLLTPLHTAETAERAVLFSFTLGVTGFTFPHRIYLSRRLGEGVKGTEKRCGMRCLPVYVRCYCFSCGVTFMRGVTFLLFLSTPYSVLGHLSPV